MNGFYKTLTVWLFACALCILCTVPFVFSQTPQITQVTSNTLDDTSPAFSPDGSKIAYTRDKKIYITNLTTNEEVLFCENCAHPTWSPDGTKIAYGLPNEGWDQSLYIKNVDGSGTITSVGVSRVGVKPFWSRDGRFIVFEQNYNPFCWRDLCYPWYAAITDLERGGSYNIAIARDPSISPDSRYMAYDKGGSLYVRVVDGNKDGSPDEAAQEYLVYGEGNAGHPLFTPDGKKLVFHSTRQDAEGASDYDIWAKTIDGNGDGIPDTTGAIVSVISNNPSNDLTMSLSSTGDKIAFMSNRENTDGTTDYEIYVTDYLEGQIVEHAKPVAVITSPKPDEQINGTIEIKGSATSTNLSTFASYKLEQGEGSAPTTWQEILTSTTEVNDNVLATWDTTNLKYTLYTLRLTVTDTDGEFSEYRVMVSVVAGELNKLTSNTADDIYPAFSPDANKIAYNRGNSIYVKDLTTNEEVLFCENCAHPTWSPDGTKIAYGSTLGGWSEVLYMKNSDGTGVETSIGVNRLGSLPSWSKDGRWIAFMERYSPYSGSYIAIKDLQGGATYALAGGNDPAFSPDNKSIVFQRSGNIYIKPLDGNLDGTPDNSGAEYLIDSGPNAGHPVFLPDGTKLVFHSTRQDADGTTDYDIWSKAIDGDGDGVPDDKGIISQIVSNYPSSEITVGVSPLGIKIAFASNRRDSQGTVDYEIYVMDYIEYGQTTQQAKPVGFITFPKPDDQLYDSVDVLGTAASSDLSTFASFTLEYGEGSAPTTWQEILTSTTEVKEGKLGMWDVSSLKKTLYTLRLRVIDADGDITEYRVKVQVPAGELSRLTVNTTDDLEPAFTPDGAKLAFTRDNKIYIKDLTTSEETLFCSNCSHPSYAPDGSKIVYRNTSDGGIYYKPVSDPAANPIFVVGSPGWYWGVHYPVWAPNGRWIMYNWICCGREYGYPLALIDIVSRYQTNLVNDGLEPSISPDSGYIAYERGGKIYVRVIDSNSDGVPDGGSEFLVDSGPKDAHPVFMPDGQKIVFHSQRQASDGTMDYDIWVKIIDGDGDGIPDDKGALSQLVSYNSAVDIQPAVSSSGSKIVYASNRADKEGTSDYELYFQDYLPLTPDVITPPGTPPPAVTTTLGGHTGGIHKFGKTIYQKEEVVNASLETLISTTIQSLPVLGKLYVKGNLRTNLLQDIASGENSFYITNSKLLLSCITDKRVYKPNETISVSCDVQNKFTDMKSSLYLALKAGSEEIFTKIFDLQPDETKTFTTTTTQTETFTLQAAVDTATISDLVVVEAPSLDVTVASPEIVGQEAFPIGIALKNTGKHDLSLTLTVRNQGTVLSEENISLSVGQLKVIQKTPTITIDTTFDITLSGDIEKTVTKKVLFGEEVQIAVTPDTIYREGVVTIPYVLQNTGALDSTFALNISLGNQAQSKTISLLKGQGLNDVLSFDLLEGNYTLAYSSVFGEASVPIIVRKFDQVDIENMTVTSGLSSLKIAAVVKNVGANDFIGSLKLDTGFFTEEQSLTLSVGESKTIESSVSAPLDAGTYTASVQAFHDGIVVKETTKEFEIQNPQFEIVNIPAGLSFTSGTQGNVVLTLKNTGLTQGQANVSFRTSDLISETKTVQLLANEEKNLTFTFNIPDDYPTQNIVGVAEVSGKQYDIPIRIEGMKISVIPALDKEAYMLGENAIVTFTLDNQSMVSPLPVFVRVQFNGFDEKKSVVLNSPATVSFTVPVIEGADSKLFYGVYQEDGGRSLVLNTLYVPLKGQTVTLTTDKQVYEIGDTVLVNVKAEEAGNFKAQYFGQEANLTFNEPGQQVFSFIVPQIRAGTYAVFYDFTRSDGTTASGSLNFDVAGYRVRVLETLLDKPVYKPHDTIHFTLRFDASTAFIGNVQGFLFSPDGLATEIFEAEKNFVAGINRFDASFQFDGGNAGLYRVVYGLFVKEPEIFLTSGSVGFEIGGVSILSLETSKEEYKDTEDVGIKFTTFGNTDGTLTMYLDGQVLSSEKKTFSGFENFEKNLGHLSPGNHTLKIRIDSDVESNKEISWRVKDTTAPPQIVDLQAVLVNVIQSQLTWTGVQDNVSVVRYKVLRLQDEPVTEVNKLLATILTNTLPSNTRTFLDTSTVPGKTYYYAVTSFDAAGNESALSNPAVVQVPSDITGPAISSIPADGGFTNNSTPEITAIITDEESGVNPQKVFVKVDGVLLDSTYDALTQKVMVAIPSEQPLTEGIHSLKITAMDIPGNTSTIDIHFTVDVTVPLISVLSPQNGSFTNNKNIVVTANLTDALSGIDATSIVLEADGIVYPVIFDAMTGELTYTWPSTIEDGAHTFTLNVKDKAGNSAPQAQSSFTLDTLVPQIMDISDAPDPFSPGSSPGRKDSTIVSVTLVEANPKDWKILIFDFLGIKIRELSGTTVNVSAVWDGKDENGIFVDNGIYLYVVVANDKAGNSSTSQENTIHVDNMIPVSTVMPTPALFNNTFASPNTAFSLNGEDPLVNGVSSGVEKIEVAVDSNDFVSYSVAVSLSEGKHTIKHKATDFAANTEDVKTFSVNVDGTSPVTQFVPSAPLSNGNDAPLSTTYIFTASDPTVLGVSSGVAKTEYTLDGGSLQIFNGHPMTLAEGIHTFVFASIDNVGNKEGDQTVTVHVDNTPPVTTLSAGNPKYQTPDKLYISPSTPVTLLANDPLVFDVASGVSKIEYRIDSGNFVMYESAFMIAEGIHTVTFRSTDNTDNVEAEKSQVFYVDKTSPVTTLSPSPSTFTNIALYTLSAIDLENAGVSSGVKEILYTIDGGTVQAFSGTPITFTDGLHTLEYFSRDNVDNEETHHSVSFTVDTTTPQLTNILDTPDPFSPGISFGVKDTTTLSASVVDANPNTWQIHVFDSLSSAVRTFNGTGTSVSQIWDGRNTQGAFINDGLYSYNIISIDKAGNKNKDTSSPDYDGTITVDKTLPVSTLTPSAALFNNLYAPLSTTYSLSADDPILGGVNSGIEKIEVAKDFEPFSAYTTPLSLTEGIRTLKFRATDAAGNTEAVRQFTARVDATSPVTTLSTSPSLYQNIFAPASVSVTLTATDPLSNSVSSGVGTTRVKLDDGVFSEYTQALSLTEGAHTFTFFSVDNVGNTEQEKTKVIKVDATPPVSQFVPSQPLFNGNYAPTTTTYTFTATDPENLSISSGVSTIFYSIDSGTQKTFTGQSVTLTSGIHTISFYAKDNVGNTEEARTVTVQVDIAPPATNLSVGTPLFMDQGKAYVSGVTPITLTATDPLFMGVSSGVARTEYNVDGGSFTSYIGSLTFNEGVHTLNYRSVDNVGNTEAQKSQVFNVDTTPPIVQVIVGEPKVNASGKTIVGASTPFTLSANDPTLLGVTTGVKGIRYRINGGAFQTAFGTSTSFTLASVAQGEVVIEFQATDRVDNTSLLQSLTVVLDTAPPAIASIVPLDNSFVNTTTPTISASVTDDGSGINSQKVFVKVDETLLSASYDVITEKVTAIPSFSLSEGTHTLKVTAFDVAGNSVTSQTIFKVDITVPNVVLQTPSNGSFTNNTNITVRALLTDTLSGVDTNSLVLKTDGVTSFFTYDSGTGALTYTWPFGITDGAHEVTLSAKDIAGNEASQVKSTFTLDTVIPQITNVSDTPDPISPANSFGVKDATTLSAGIVDINADVWNLTILNPQNNPVKVSSGSGNNLSVPWNGTDANNMPVQDGVYSYTLSAKDKAGNISEGSALQQTIVLEDTFDSPSIDTGKWTVTNDDSGLTVTQNNGTLKISGQPTQAGGSPIGNGVASKLFADSGSNFTLEFDADLSSSQINSGASVSANVVFGNLATGSAALLQYFYHSQTFFELRFLGQSIPVQTSSGHVVISYNASAKTLSLSFNGEKKTEQALTLTSGVFSFLAAGGATTDVVNVSYDNFSLKQEALTANAIVGTVTVDNTNPVSHLEILGSQYTSDTLYIPGTTQLSVSFEDPTVNNVSSGVEYAQYAVDAGDLQNYISSFTLVEGRHNIRHRATDKAGNSSPQEFVELSVDATAPVTILSPAPKQFTNVSRYALSVSDPENFGVKSGVRETRYRIDGAEHVYNGAPISLSDGYHTLEYFSVDNVGNEEQHHVVTFTVDITKPEVTNISDAPDPFSPGASSGVKDTNTISANVNDANADRWELQLFDTANNPAQTFNGSGSFITQPWNGQLSIGGIAPDGLYAYSILATDKAGNTNKEVTGGTTNILLQDDFNDGVLDLSKWNPNALPSDPGLTVTEEEGQLRISGTASSVNPGDNVSGVVANVMADPQKKLNLSVDVDLSRTQASSSESKSAFALVLLGSFTSNALITFYYTPDAGNYQLLYQTFDGQQGFLGTVPASGTIGLQYDPAVSSISISFNGEQKATAPINITDTALTILAATGQTGTFVDVRFDNFLLTEESSSNGGGNTVQVSDNFDDGQIDTSTWETQGPYRGRNQYTLEEKEGHLLFSGIAQYNDPEFVGAKQALSSTEDFSVSVFVDLTQSEIGPENSGTSPEAVPLAALAIGNEFKIYASILTQQPTKTYRLFAFSQEAGFITLGDVATGAGQFLINYNAATKALDVFFNGNKQTTLQTTWAQEQLFVLLGAAGYVGDTVVVKFDNFSITQGESGEGGNGVPPMSDGYVTVDNTSPATALEIVGVSYAQNNETFVSGTTQLAVTANDPVVNSVNAGVETTEYAVDNGNLQPYTTPFTLPEGARNVRHKATDNAGNFSEQQTTLKVDTTAPVTTLTPMPTEFTDIMDYTLSATDPVSNNVSAGVKEMRYKVDGGIEQVATGNVPLHFTGGLHTIEYLSIDNVLNTEQKRTVTFTVDNIPPVLKNVSDMPDPFSPGVSTGIKDTNTISATLEDMSDVTWQIGLFDAANATVQNFNGSGKTVQQAWDGKDAQGSFVNDGLYSYSISATDKVGNKNKDASPQAADGTVVVDKTNPLSTLSPSVSLFNNQYAPTSTTYAVTADDPVVNGVNAGVEKIEVQKDSETFVMYTSALSLEEGRHTLQHKATDNAGNMEDVKTFAVDVDGTAPVSTLSPSASMFNNVYAPISTTYALSATDIVSHDVSSGVLKTVYKIDGGEETLYSSALTLTEGEHTIAYFSKDNVLNVEDEKAFTVKVDNTAPVTQIVPSAPLFANQYAPVSTTYTFSTNDPQSFGVASGVSKVEYTLDGGVTNTYTGNPITLTEGIHTFTFFATDNVENKEEAKTFTVHVDNTSPVAQISVGAPQCTEDGKVIVSATTQLNVTATDPETSAVSSGVKETRYRVNGGDWKVFTGSFTLSQADGDVTIEFQAEDNVGNIQTLQSTTVTLDTTSPTTALLSPQDGSVISGIVSVMGTVVDSHFTNGNYTLQFSAGQSPTSFTDIATGSSQNTCTSQSASCDPLGTWNTAGLTQDMLYTLKLTATDCVGNVGAVQALLRIGSPTVAISYGEKSTGQPTDGTFNQPTGLATITGSNGQTLTLIADRQNHRIEVFNENGQFVAKFGEKSTGPAPNNGEFNEPTEIVADSAGNIYVVDSLNDRVQKFDNNYNFVAAYGTHGNGAGQFNKPYGIALDAEGNLYITDTQNNRVQKLDASGNFMKEWTFAKRTVNDQDETFTFNKPSGITLDVQGNLFVSDTQNDRILKFAQDGTLLRIYSLSGDAALKQPAGLTLDNSGNLYIADEMNHRVVKFDAFGNVVFTFGGKTEGNPAPEGTFNQVADVQLDATQKFLLVSDVHNHRIQVFALSVSAPPIAKLVSQKNDDKNAIITDPNLLNVLKVVPFPTPSRGKLSFNLEAEGNVTQITLEVYTINGKRVLTEYLPVQAATGAKGKGKFKAESPSLDAVLSSLPNGVYVYRLQISNGVKTVNKTGKFVVVR